MVSILRNSLGSLSPFKGTPGEAAPANENTPLSGGDASSQFISETAQKANEYAREKAKELRIMAKEGDFGIRVLALMGGLAMMVVSAFGFVGTLLKFNFLHTLVEVYTFLLGVIVILLEGTKFPWVKTKYREGVNKYALFLSFVWGRGCLYFVAGSLQLTQASLLDIVVGAYMMLVGIAYLVVGHQTAQKLKKMRRELFSQEALRLKFDQADSNSTGQLTIGQFKTLTDSMGLDLNRREVEAAFLHMDRQDDGLLSFEEFTNWWKEWDDQDQHANSPFDLVV